MRDLIRILLIVGLGYGLYTYFIQQQNAPESEAALAEEGSATRCVQRLDQAGDAIEKALRTYGTKPLDTAAWRQDKVRLDRRVAVARAACNCYGEACERGMEAVGNARQLVVDMHDAHGLGDPLFASGERLDAFRRLQEQTQALNR